MHFIVNDFDLYYEKYGENEEPILILPGWGDTRETFLPLIETLKEHFTIYIIDYPGFGKSSFPNRDLYIEDYAILIKDFIKVNHLENTNIIAHSFGGRILSFLKGKYELPLSKIILMDIAGLKNKKTLKQKIKEKTYKLLKKIKYFLPKKQKENYLNFLIQIFGSNDFQQLPPQIRNTFIHIVQEDLEENFKNIKGDILIIWGENDQITSLSDGRKIHNLIKGSILIPIKNATHFPYIEQKQLVTNIILSYLLPKEKRNN